MKLKDGFIEVGCYDDWDFVVEYFELFDGKEISWTQSKTSVCDCLVSWSDRLNVYLKSIGVDPITVKPFHKTKYLKHNKLIENL